jgi:hypothetical protein
LAGNFESLPSHVRDKIQEKLRSHLKSASKQASSVSTLRQRLDFADLRELQDTLLNPALWKLFHEIFKTKEQLTLRFGQLAELRNCIRHSRPIDEINLKEGEASTIWFEKVLASALYLGSGSGSL